MCNQHYHVHVIYVAQKTVFIMVTSFKIPTMTFSLVEIPLFYSIPVLAGDEKIISNITVTSKGIIFTSYNCFLGFCKKDM